ncbi:hypothetical protein KOW79_006656 [Hemibagrus wyckioides]|uniref:Uncharacterized protein n=1 Tax=Hemibagrus wyckioides TaxID=337641 RepID=A0A9D3NYE2_9TELE|nr:hypothetical protein KOW79_006656 [Hemibagrus wyckioides]
MRARPPTAGFCGKQRSDWLVVRAHPGTLRLFLDCQGPQKPEQNAIQRGERAVAAYRRVKMRAGHRRLVCGNRGATAGHTRPPALLDKSAATRGRPAGKTRTGNPRPLYGPPGRADLFRMASGQAGHTTARRSLWRNRLARSAVNRKVGGSSPPRDAEAFLRLPGASEARAERKQRAGHTRPPALLDKSAATRGGGQPAKRCTGNPRPLYGPPGRADLFRMASGQAGHTTARRLPGASEARAERINREVKDGGCLSESQNAAPATGGWFVETEERLPGTPDHLPSWTKARPLGAASRQSSVPGNPRPLYGPPGRADLSDGERASGHTTAAQVSVAQSVSGVRLLTERLVVRAHPGALRLFLDCQGPQKPEQNANREVGGSSPPRDAEAFLRLPGPQKPEQNANREVKERWLPIGGSKCAPATDGWFVETEERLPGTPDHLPSWTKARPLGGGQPAKQRTGNPRPLYGPPGRADLFRMASGQSRTHHRAQVSVAQSVSCVRLLTERLVVQAHPGTLRLFLDCQGPQKPEQNANREVKDGGCLSESQNARPATDGWFVETEERLPGTPDHLPSWTKARPLGGGQPAKQRTGNPRPLYGPPGRADLFRMASGQAGHTTARRSLWRQSVKRRSAVNRKVGGSSPPRDAEAFLRLPGASEARAERKQRGERAVAAYRRVKMRTRPPTAAGHTRPPALLDKSAATRGRPAGKTAYRQPAAALRPTGTRCPFPDGERASRTHLCTQVSVAQSVKRRSAVNRKVGGSSPPRDAEAFLRLPGASEARAERINREVKDGGCLSESQNARRPPTAGLWKQRSDW